jgi:tetratricopeptide (TPR) repeat protein
MTRGRNTAFASAALLGCALSLSTAAHAGGAQDGEAGLQALDRGSYDEAVRLFTRALGARDLSNDDREFAYLSRGKAYLGEGDKTDALADLHRAVQLKPDDADAQAALSQAIGDRANQTSVQQGGDRWGLLASMAGHYYWFQASGADPHAAVFHAAWATPNVALSTSLRAKTTTVQIQEYLLDEASAKLLWAGYVTNTLYYGTAEATASSVVIYSYPNGTPARASLTLAVDGTIRDHEQVFKDGAWSDAGDALLVEVPQETLEAEGLLKKKK